MIERIAKFLKYQTCASICCMDEAGRPWCFTCYYAFDADNMLLYYKSHAHTRHNDALLCNRSLAGTMLPDKLNKLMVQGVQFEGQLLDAEDPLAKHASAQYHARHPLAKTMPGTMYSIRIDYIKMTDSTLGFGKKLTWSRQPAAVPENY